MKSALFRTAATALTFGVAVALGTGSGPAGAADSSPQSTAADWNMVGEIVGKIQSPSIPNRNYAVTLFGATGDGKQDARPAILAAIEQAAKEGGGRVVLPKGTWLSKGPIHLKSRINLHVSEGATLLFGPDAKDYLRAAQQAG
jgi:polygalacturonase